MSILRHKGNALEYLQVGMENDPRREPIKRPGGPPLEPRSPVSDCHADIFCKCMEPLSLPGYGIFYIQLLPRLSPYAALILLSTLIFSCFLCEPVIFQYRGSEAPECAVLRTYHLTTPLGLWKPRSCLMHLNRSMGLGLYPWIRDRMLGYLAQIGHNNRSVSSKIAGM